MSEAKGEPIDLELPKVNTGSGPGSARDRSHTEAKLLLGFFEQVSFVPWPQEELDSIFADALDDLSIIREEARSEVERLLKQARKQIDKIVVGDEELNAVKKQIRLALLQRKQERDSSRAGNVSANTCAHQAVSGHSTFDGATATSSAAPASSASATANVVHGPKRPSEGASSIQETETGSKKKRLRHTNPAAAESEDVRPIFDTSTSVDKVHTQVMLALEAMVNEIVPTFVDDERFEVITKEQTLPEIEGETNSGKKPKRSPSAGKKHTPDKALVRYIGNEVVGSPLCGYEFKGPRMDLGHHARALDDFLKGKPPKSRRRRGRKVEGNQGSSARDCQPEQQGGTQKSRAAGVEGGGGERGEVHGLGDTATIVCAVVMCQYLNRMFESLRNANPSTRDQFVTLDRLGPIAQTLSQGLCAQSGCCMLYTHQQGIAFKIKGKLDSEKIEIWVTPLLRCDDKRGALCLMLSLSHHSVHYSNEPGVHAKVKEAARLIKASRDSRTKPSAAGSTSMQNDTRESEKGGTESGHIQEELGTSQGQHKSNESVDQDISSFVTLVADAKNYTAWDVMRHVADQRKKVIARGANALLLLGSIVNQPVLIKVWSEEDESGLAELCHEVEMYQTIKDRFPFLLGSTLPQIFLARNQPIEGAPYGGDVFVVMESVGQQICRDKDGELVVECGGTRRRVDPDEECAIRESAQEGLNSLHRCNVLHGDVALRNLRVERPQEDDGVWRTWWIDLGRGSIDHTRDGFEKWLEIRECDALFNF